MVRPIGFSTGAVAQTDFRLALQLVDKLPVNSLELSALRLHELEPLVAGIPTLNLSRYRYISVHAPSTFKPSDEASVVALLQRLPPDWPIILHPDQIKNPDRWRPLGSKVAIENMDVRKSTGRTVDELRPFFKTLPDARFCFDVGHALICQVPLDPFLDAFGYRLVQIHASQVTRSGKHQALSSQQGHTISLVASRIPLDIPIIIESVVDPQELANELTAVQTAFLAG